MRCLLFEIGITIYIFLLTQNTDLKIDRSVALLINWDHYFSIRDYNVHHTCCLKLYIIVEFYVFSAQIYVRYSPIPFLLAVLRDRISYTLQENAGLCPVLENGGHGWRAEALWPLALQLWLGHIVCYSIGRVWKAGSKVFRVYPALLHIRNTLASTCMGWIIYLIVSHASLKLCILLREVWSRFT